jgi:L-arabinose isomerase
MNKRLLIVRCGRVVGMWWKRERKREIKRWMRSTRAF